MVVRTCALVAALAVAPCAAAEYTSASELFDAILDAQQARAEGVSNYAMDVTMMDQPTTQYYERTPMETGDRVLQVFRLVPLHEIQQRLGSDGGAVPDGVGGLTSGFARQAAEADHTALIAERAEIAGMEPIDGRDAYVVKADDLNIVQESDGSEFVIRSMTFWVDARDLVTPKMRMDGVVKQDGQTREMFLEKRDRDFRRVPGSGLLLPYRSVVRMGGLLGPKEQKEMEQARAQLADLDRQMASMPPDQKAMMQNTMGPRIETMRKMVESGTFEAETTVWAVRVNPGIAEAFPAAPSKNGMGDLMRLAQTGMSPPKQDDGSLQRAREACLQRKVEEAEAKKKKKKRFGKLLGAVGRIAGRHATGGLATDVNRVSTSVYQAGATARDLDEAAEALGISKEDVAACENPGGTR